MKKFDTPIKVTLTDTRATDNGTESYTHDELISEAKVVSTSDVLQDGIPAKKIRMEMTLADGKTSCVKDYIWTVEDFHDIMLGNLLQSEYNI